MFGRDQWRRQVLDNYTFGAFVKSGPTVQKPPECVLEQSLHVELDQANQWLERKIPPRVLGETLCLWGHRPMPEPRPARKAFAARTRHARNFRTPSSSGTCSRWRIWLLRSGPEAWTSGQFLAGRGRGECQTLPSDGTLAIVPAPGSHSGRPSKRPRMARQRYGGQSHVMWSMCAECH